MNQRTGVATTIALLFAALLGVSYLPRKAGESAKTDDGRKSPAAATLAGGHVASPSPEQALVPACEQIRRQLLRFYPDGVPIPSDGDCDAGKATNPGPTPPLDSPASFAIAIVPNPVQTHLPLMFDREIESIQQAIQDIGFSYDSSWFPWVQSSKSNDSLSEEQQSADLTAELHEQPGIMVFRQGAGVNVLGNPYRHGLVIFVVAEQPTGGIDDTQFRHALRWITALQSSPCALRIIGPSFSGTLESLARELEATGAMTKFPDSVTIFSGATNADENVNRFNQFLAEQAGLRTLGGVHLGPVQFRTFFESDALMTDRFLCYMQHKGYDLNLFAILSEDETAFGKALGKSESEKPRCQDHFGKKERDEGTPAYLYYPRDIATLRSAYEQQSIFTVGKPDANAPSTTLKQDLSEPGSAEHDTVRRYAGKLTPQAQEAILFGISDVLDSKHIEFVILRSSNTLDQLFLSEFLRRSYPNGRVIIDGADLMFRRGMEGASLRGVMMLSPYPLLSWTHDAVPTIEGGGSASLRVFQQDSSEGTYIATREILKGVPGAASAVSVADYGSPEWIRAKAASRHADIPPTWLTVVGHGQFWPLAVLNDETEVDASGKYYGPNDTPLLQPEPNQPGGHSLRTGLPGEMWALLISCAVLAAWHWYCCASGSIFRPPRLRAYFAPVPRLQHTVLIFLGSLVLAFLGITLWFMIAVHGLSVLSFPALAGLVILISATLVFASAGCFSNYRLHVITGKTGPGRIARLQRIERWRARLTWLWFPVVAVLGLIRYFYLTHHLGSADRIPTFWRTVFLRSGVSGLLPQVLLLLGLYAWYWFNLHGMALFGDDRPVLPKVDDLPPFEVPANHYEEAHNLHTRVLRVFRIFSEEGAGSNIESEARPLGKRYRNSVKYFLPIAWIVLWIAVGSPTFQFQWDWNFLPGLRTLGDIRFGTAIFFGVVVCTSLILADTMQLLNTWSQLRQLLIFLDRLRLRRTLATLRGLYGGSVWKMSGNVLEERYRLISRQFESLRNLDNALKAWKTNGDDQKQHRDIARKQVEQCEQVGAAFTAWYVDLLDDGITLRDRPDKQYNIEPLTDFQKMLAATAGCMMEQIILPEWRADLNTMVRVSTSKDLESDFDKQVADLPAHVSAAEEFFLLPYMGFIQNILGRVRTIGLSIVVVFVAMTLAVSSYPFDPLPVIGAVFLILFVVVGVGMIFTYAEMCRDATLSRIADTKPGELGWTFWAKMIALGAGPLLGLLTTLFPSMTDFIVSFVQPGAQAIK